MKNGFYLGVLLISSVATARPHLDFSLGQKSVMLINASTSSCKSIAQGKPDSAVSGVYGEIPELQLNWHGQTPLNLHSIQVLIPNTEDMTAIKASFTGGLLVYTWYADTNEHKSIPLSPGMNTNACPVKFGGIAVWDPRRSFSGKGQIGVHGTYVDDDGSTVPVTEVIDFNYQFDGI